MKILLACDRSKGHSYPALVLARYIRGHRPYDRVVFYGLKRQDRDSVQAEGFRSFGLDIGRRNIIIESIFLFLEALVLLVVVRPKRVVGFGGRNSFFAVLISSLFIPVFLFEPNATFGKANNILSFFSKRVFLGLKEPCRAKEIALGVPLRDEIIGTDLKREEALKTLSLDPGIKTILVFGGSSGSSFINDIFLKCATLLKEQGYSFQVIHITGSKDYQNTLSRYRQIGIKACVFDFYTKMGILYKASDLVLARSGASTLAEIAFFSKPALLIPYPYAYSHQLKNASFFGSKGAALVEEQFSLNNQRLRDIVRGLLDDSHKAGSSGLKAKNQIIWSRGEDFSKKLLSYI